MQPAAPPWWHHGNSTRLQEIQTSDSKAVQQCEQHLNKPGRCWQLHRYSEEEEEKENLLLCLHGCRADCELSKLQVVCDMVHRIA
jgi:hypothetical protein